MVRFEGCDSREQAAKLTGRLVMVERAAFKPAADGEFYWADLAGFEVINLAGVPLGVVDQFMDLPANPVMVVKGERERWVPVTERHLRSVEHEARRVVVDWPEDF